MSLSQKELENPQLDECHDGYYICDRCEGSGKLKMFPTLICDKCWGAGFLDWVEKITGKEQPFKVSSSSTSSSRSCSSSQVLRKRRWF